jgi:Putative beta-barrel porin 2
MPATLVLLAATSNSRASEPGYQISVGVIESDNIERVPTGGTSDTVLEQELNFTWHELRPLFNADIEADLSHLTYVPRTFSDQVIGNFIGTGRFALVPQYFFWNFSDNFGQGSADPTQAITPATRENINYFSTGPEALLPLGGENLLDVKATYGKVNYQTSPFDNERFSGGLGFIHRLSAQTEVSLNASDERIDYSNSTVNGAVNPDYDVQQAFAHFDTKGNRTTLGVDVGYGRLLESGSTTGTFTGRLELSRKISAFSTVSLSFGREYSDAAAAFQISQVLSGANLSSQNTTQTGGPFTMVYETAGWNFLRNRTGFGITLSHFNDDYVESNTFNDTRTEVDANVSRQLSPLLRATLLESYYRQNFENIPGSSSQSITDARLTWQLSRRVSAFLDYTYTKRTSDIASTEFTENRVWISIGYGRPAEVPPGVPAPPLAHPTTY